MTGTGALLLALSVPLAWLEWQRRDRAHLRLRLSGAFATAAGLALIALPDQSPAGTVGAGSALPSGVERLNAPTTIALGERLEIAGRLTLPVGDTALVRLEGPAGLGDSASVNGRDGTFELADTPRAEGGATYRLEVRRRGALLAVESIGVAVQRRIPPTILILDGSPNFETAWLKRWLSERGGRATIRTTVSRGRFRTEEVNGPTADPRRLTPSVLGKYAAVLADASALRALSAVERAALESAIREDGLGLLVTADVPAAIAAGEPLLPGLRSDGAGEESRRTTRVRWEGAPRSVPAAMEVENSRLRVPRDAEALARDESGDVLAAWWGAGAGRVAATLVRTPSRWTLEGDADRFTSYWTTLLGAVARDTVTRVAVTSAPASVDRRATIEVITSGPRPIVEVVAPDGLGDTLALARDPFDPRRLSGSYWPRTGGWHAIRVGGREVPFLATRADSSPTAAAPRHRSGLEFARVLGFVLLLLTLTGLWAESRFRTGR